MLLNCGVGEDSWEPLGLQGDPTSLSYRKSVLNIHWKDWCWSWSSNTLATWCRELTHWKDPDAGKDWGQEKKRTTEDEMVGWHHWLNGHEFEQAPGIGDGQGSLAGCSPWGYKESDTTERLKWYCRKGFPGGTRSEEPACWCRRHKRFRFHPWVGKIPEGDRATHSSVLARRIPWTEEPGGYSPEGHKELEIMEVT